MASAATTTKERTGSCDTSGSVTEVSEGGGWLTKSIQRKASISTLPGLQGSRLQPFDPYTFPLGDKAPQEIPVFIEVSAGSRNKYEWDSEHGVLMLDRVLHSAVFYPNDYGFVPCTLCDDGDPLDVLVMGTHPLVPGCLVRVRPIAYLVMQDEKGRDEKVLGVLSKDPMFHDVKSFEDLPKHKLREIGHFFETYKTLEANKWARVGDWEGTEATYDLIKSTHQHFLDSSKEIEDKL